MRKFKLWLIDQFLPAWAKESVYRENEHLKEEIRQLKADIDCLNAYIDGMRTQRRVTIHNEVKK